MVLLAVNLFGLLGPGEVVRTRLGACVCFNNGLQPWPEFDHFQWPIEPTSGN